MSLLLGAWALPLILGLPSLPDLPPSIMALSSIRSAGDTNGDGVCDVLVADRDASGAERVRIISGTDGSVLRELRGRKPGDWFGFSMACVGDIDGDTIPEIAVGARGGEYVAKEGGLELWRVRQDEQQAYVRLFSGRDGHLIEEFDGDFICGRGTDFDADGTLDLLFGAGDFSTLREAGFVEVRSGAKHRSLLNLNPRDEEPTARTFGASVCVLPDLDGDSIPEVVVCSPSAGGLGSRASLVVIASGKRGQTIVEATNDPEESQVGWTLVVAGDLDGDRKPDLLLASPKRFVRALSGVSLKTIYTVPSPGGIEEGFATSLDVVPDLDGDGVPDFVVGCDEENDVFDRGYANLYSGKTGQRIRVLFESKTEGVEVCSLRDGKWDATERTALRIRTRRPPSSDPKILGMLKPLDVLRIVSCRTGETLFESSLSAP